MYYSLKIFFVVAYFSMLAFSYEIYKETAIVTHVSSPSSKPTTISTTAPTIESTIKPTSVSNSNDDIYTQDLNSANANLNSGLNNATSVVDSADAWLNNLINEVNNFFDKLGYYVGYGTIIAALIAGFCPWAQVHCCYRI